MANILGQLYDFKGSSTLETIHPHRLSVLFAILASGAFWDEQPTAKILAQQYLVLSRAALSLKPILRETTTAAVQALFTIVRFLHIADTTAGEERWILGGTCAKVAQSVMPHPYLFDEFY